MNASMKQRLRNILFLKFRELVCVSNVSILRKCFRWLQERRFINNLQLLHDVLKDTEFSGRYWIWGGLLLGWARERRILPHDHPDADFAYFHEDRERFLAVIDPLIRAGFIPLFKFTNNDGVVTQHSFAKDGVKFEFFEMYADDRNIRYWIYSASDGVQITCEVPRHGVADMYFLDRTWLKPDNHDRYLRALYGNWLEPQSEYNSATDARSIREIHKWGGGFEWS